MSWLKAFVISLIMMTHLELYNFNNKSGNNFQKGWHRGEKSSSLYAILVCMGVFCILGGKYI